MLVKPAAPCIKDLQAVTVIKLNQQLDEGGPRKHGLADREQGRKDEHRSG
jgi:hypothetical protein